MTEKDLGPEGKRFYKQVKAGYQIDEAETTVLLHACRCLDRAAEAGKILERDGVIVQGETTPHKHPAFGVETEAKRQFLGFLKGLGIGEEPPADTRRPGVGGRPPGQRIP